MDIAWIIGTWFIVGVLAAKVINVFTGFFDHPQSTPFLVIGIFCAPVLFIIMLFVVAHAFITK